MIVDTHVHIANRSTGVWKHPPFTAEQLIGLMDRSTAFGGRDRRIDMSIVQPQPAETISSEVSFIDQHAYVTEVVTKYPYRLVGCMTINPHLGVEKGIEALRHLVLHRGYRAVKLHPTTHAYMPPRATELLFPIIEAAGALDIPVIIHTGDPPFAVPVLMVPLAEAYPGTKIIIAHLGSQKVTYADEAIYMARKLDNIFLDTGWGTLPRIKEAVAALGTSKLLFGSDAPIQEQWSQLRNIEVLGWQPPIGMRLSEDDVERIAGGNAVDLFGLKGRQAAGT